MTKAPERKGDGLTAEETRALRALKSPAGIQSFLDAVPYSTDHFYRAPRQVLRDRRAHCFDGAMLAAAAMRQLGEPPLLMDLRAHRDDDHVLCLYRRGGLWGAVAKSNCTGIRFREPIHRSLRELAMTYFENYFNVEGEKSLRGYSAALELTRFDALGWETDPDAMETIALALDRARHYPFLPPGMARRLTRVDERAYAAGFLGADDAGLYKPTPRKRR